MIKIKNYIFNENEIEFIEKIENGIRICPKTFNVKIREIKDATFEDIEWNYENNNEYCNVFYEDRIKELEEENKRLKEVQCTFCGTGCIDKRKELEDRINKAIKKLENMKNIKGGMNSTILQAINDVDNTINILKGRRNK